MAQKKKQNELEDLEPASIHDSTEEAEQQGLVLADFSDKNIQKLAKLSRTMTSYQDVL